MDCFLFSSIETYKQYHVMIQSMCHEFIMNVNIYHINTQFVSQISFLFLFYQSNGILPSSFIGSANGSQNQAGGTRLS